MNKKTSKLILLTTLATLFTTFCNTVGATEKEVIQESITPSSNSLNTSGLASLENGQAASVAQTIVCPSLPKSEPGVCYAKVLNAPIYKTKNIRRLQVEASSKLEIVPAKYRTVQQKILVKDAYDEFNIVPATYEWIEQRILVQPSYDRIERVSATYINEPERVMISPAKQIWKVGTETNIQKLDAATGNVMCLVDVPAKYETRTVKRQITAASTRKIHVPAVYKTIKKRVVKTPATTIVTQRIPAEYKIVKVHQVVEPRIERVVQIPAEYQNVAVKELVQEARCEWRQILCSVNATSSLVRQIENKLKASGHNPGLIDGKMDSNLFKATREYQSARGLAVDPSNLDVINVDTLRTMGISYK